MMKLMIFPKLLAPDGRKSAMTIPLVDGVESGIVTPIDLQLLIYGIKLDDGMFVNYLKSYVY